MTSPDPRFREGFLLASEFVFPTPIDAVSDFPFPWPSAKIFKLAVKTKQATSINRSIYQRNIGSHKFKVSQLFTKMSQRAVEWPFEHFPPPPSDGYWIPKFAPSKSPLPLNSTPDPPIMALAYPPPPPLAEEDPTWLNQMLADVVRQRSHLERCLSQVQTDVANAYVEAGLADAELEEERAKTQAFLNLVASVAGSGFVRRMLEDVEHSVEVMSRPQGDNEDSGCDSPSSSSSTHNATPPAV
ncbi:hypothetical protein J3R82DRAFT_7665 [Butyriboletus roseoflavus]|nr:hypothetical protein J3R82DRAFT_7665 [Butyriboletus roseoflavus]